ncbi:MAG: DUF4065 domain-containing protein [Peptococcaceae bacterium]|nr:DUF4065 domain-containing protein [Peptococcaceae bacterium]
MTETNSKRMVEMDCPFCDEYHSVEEGMRTAQALVKGEIVHYEQVYYRCAVSSDEDNEFVPAGVMDDNLLRARNAYRTSEGLLSSEEIAQIREVYGLSQSDFAALLGWGEVTVTRYESKSVQDETYDRIMRMVSDNPLFALESLDKHSDRFSADKYTQIRRRIIERVSVGVHFLKQQEIRAAYVDYVQKTDLNGYQVLDLNMVGNVIAYYADRVPNLYKVKLMKLLWYTDALCFRRHRRAMTGLVYKHMPLGALPLGYNEIIHLPSVKVVEELLGDDIGYRICPLVATDDLNFTSQELNVLNTVAMALGAMRTQEIVDYMHAERAYVATALNEVIPFSLAKDLRELR